MDTPIHARRNKWVSLMQIHPGTAMYLEALPIVREDMFIDTPVSRFDTLAAIPNSAPKHWKNSCVHSECTLHQLSPYIGKLKSSIVRDLIEAYSKPGDLVIDPFAGSGTVPLEAALLGRKVFAADISPYAKILTIAKLSAPPSLEDALESAEKALLQATLQPGPNIKNIPSWVKQFFHPQTLKEAIRFSAIAGKKGYEFLMACFLGILHHERPGFLSYPASHLVPYLRQKKYPPDKYPGMYLYRELKPRLTAKITRAYKRRGSFIPGSSWIFRQSDIENLTFPDHFDCLISSPPYMNTLDYGRDNRLRMWFISPEGIDRTDNPVTRDKKAFESALACMGEKINTRLKRGGYCILVVGERISVGHSTYLSEIISRIMLEKAPNLRLISITKDRIPDIRRSRKKCSGTKDEHILVFQRL